VIVGVPKEIKTDEYRVSVVPVGVGELVRNGHEVLVEKNAGQGSGIDNADYERCGAEIVDTPDEVFARSDMIVKVKEPLPQELPLLRPGQMVFTYFHLAASRELAESVLEKSIVGIAYETIRLPDGTLPLLIPMSEIAGRMAVHEGAKCLEKQLGGMGILLAGVPGVAPANVTIIGAGVVGMNAARVAAGLLARVTVLDLSLPRLRYIEDVMPPNVNTLYSNPHNIEKSVLNADLLIGAVLVPGARAAVLVSEDLVKNMKRGAAVVDVCIDQGGCIATSRPTTHSNPTYIAHGCVHYCVTNIPGVVGGTSTYALTNATQPYVLELANTGWKAAAGEDPAIASGLNVIDGMLCNEAVARSFGMQCHDWRKLARTPQK